MTTQKEKNFYQSKLQYFKEMCYVCTIVSCISSVFYLMTDIIAFGGFPAQCVLPRCLPIVMMLIYVFIYSKTNNYRVIVPMSYLSLHFIMFCTYWALSFRTEHIHANEGFLLMHLMFLVLGLSAPFKYSIIWHPMFLLDIVLSNLVNHYESFSLMIVMNIPCIAAVCIVNYYMENVYFDHYQTKNQLDDMMQHDNLTKAFNRNIFSQICSKETGKLLITQKETAVLMIDVDFFKKINDTYGHETGDAVLKHLAAKLKDMINSDDYVIRWGGEEFIILLCGYSSEEAKNKAEIICQGIEADSTGQCKITISVGGIMYNASESLQNSISKADYAMYQAKKGGRNRVVFLTD